ncbi:MAG: hypothetical protein ACO3GP_05250 [Candidatus Limnocylindrus sp.]|jgi:hypothetical protein
MSAPVDRDELSRVVKLYTEAVYKLLHYEAALHTIANMSRDQCEDAHAIARRALERLNDGQSRAN